MTDMISFTTDTGEVMKVPASDATIVDQDPSKTVYAYSNPGGSTLLAVRSTRRNPGHSGMDMYGSHPDISMEDQLEEDVLSSSMDMMEETRDNPSGRLFDWKNLRLQAAISGEAAIRVTRRIMPGRILKLRKISTKESIRDTPQLLAATTTEDWYTYVSNMSKNPIDMGAELSASVTPGQRFAVAQFVSEWEKDPGHTTLLRKAVPGADTNDLIAKGQIAYDIMTGRGPNPLQAKGYGTFQYDKMFRLAYDIITSLPIHTYNSYTTYQLGHHEGESVYRDMFSTYVALELEEVAMVLEIRRKLAEVGPGYANLVINNTGVAGEAAELMQKAASAYDRGDTSRVRSILTYLQEDPFYYGGTIGGALANLEKIGSEKLGRGDIFPFHISKKVPADFQPFVRNKTVYLSKPDFDPSEHMDVNTGLPKNDKKKDFSTNKYSFAVHKSVFDSEQVGVLKFDSIDKYMFDSTARLMDRPKTSNQKRDAVGEAVEALARSNPPREHLQKGLCHHVSATDPYTGIYYACSKPAGHAGKHDLSIEYQSAETEEGPNPFDNPSPKGRGKYYYVQVHPKTQLKMKKRGTTATGVGDKRHGDKSKKGQKFWMRGLYQVLDKMTTADNKKYAKGGTGKRVPEMGLAVQVGKHKKTGEEAPFMIRLPTHFFRVVTHPEYGYKTIMPRKDKANKDFIEAYTAFLKYYGVPKMSPTKDVHFRFVVPKAERGSYYDALRRKVGGAKRSR
jgi:hypothetical protein